MHIEVDSHTHTIASGHAYSTLAENIAAAAERGLKLLAITDHGPAMPGAPHAWFFMNMRVIPRIINGVGVLRGVEANIMNRNGELDLQVDILQRMDLVLGSLHDPLFAPQNKTIHTDTVIKTMASGQIDVFAHGGNPAFSIDPVEVAKAAAEYRVLIEINNSSFTTSRPGSEPNCRALAEAVALHGGQLTFGTDAHIASRVGVFDQCVALVQSIDFPEEQIISRSGIDFLNFLSSKNKPADLSELRSLFDLK
jgi:putative hydrolase